MNEPRENDPLIDALLDEVVGGVRPPDLTKKILAAYALRVARATMVDGSSEIDAPLSVLPTGRIGSTIDRALRNGQSPHADECEIEAPPIVARAPQKQQVEASGKAGHVGSRRFAWAPFTAASLAIVVAVTAYLGYRFQSGDPLKPNLAQNGSPKETDPGNADPGTLGSRTPGSSTPDDPGAELIGQSEPNPKSPSQGPSEEGTTELVQGSTDKPTNDPGSLAKTEGSDPKPDTAPATNVASTDPPQRNRTRKQVDTELVSFVNTKLADSWKDAQVTPSPAATDAEWCRRVYVRLLGRVPTRAELDRYVGSKAKSKREDLVELLMNGPQTRDEYAAHWASIWANALIGRVAGMKPDEPASRAGFEQYLRDAITIDKPYDVMVKELLTATGSGKLGEQPSSDEPFNGAANFLLANHSENGVLAAARVSRVFLGVQLQCAQCHAHPTNNLSQHQFWAFNSFFRQTSVKKSNSGQTLLVSRDFAGESGKNLDEAEVYYEQRNGVLKAAYPEFLDGTPISRSGRLSENDRRKALAEWIVKSDRLAQAAANRVWAHFLGYGFTRPVDDIGGDNPPSHPELLAKLAAEFASEGYSLKRLSKWIVLSDAFNRSSKILPTNVADSPESGERPLFAHYYTRQMQAEEVYQSLLIAARLRETNSDPLAARTQWSGQFARNMETDEGDEESSFNGTIKQQLTMMNGDLMRKATHPGNGNLLETVIQSKMSFDEKVEHLFLSALSRRPNQREIDAARKLRQSSSKGLDGEATALSDTWWALLNSNEFILDH